MPKFRATLRVSELTGQDPAAIQRTLEEKLKLAGVEKWRILKIEAEAAETRNAHAPASGPDRREPAPTPTAGGFLLVMAGALALWFFWYLSSSGSASF